MCNRTRPTGLDYCLKPEQLTYLMLAMSVYLSWHGMGGHEFRLQNSHKIFKVHTPTGFGPSVSGASVCPSVSHPD